MAGNICTVGYTIGEENPTYTGGAYDGDTTDPNATGAWYAWATPNYKNTGWTGQEFPSAVVVNKYDVISLNATGRTTDPKSWTFEGWDGAAWVTLDTQTNQSFTQKQTKEYPFTNSSAYTKYRINVSANNGSTGYLTIQELYMYEAEGPVLEIDAATSVDTDSATLNGEVTDMGEEASLDISFQYGETTGYGTEPTPETITAIGVVSANISGLDSETTYHFRLKATNGVDTWYSADNTFTTDSSSTPVLETDAATSIEAYAATLNGELTDMGGIASLDVYFEYGLTTSYGSETTPETLTATGVFDAEITEIESHTTYHYRAVVTDGTDTWYGDDATFFSLYSFAPPAPVNLQGDPGPFTILWSWEEPYFIWPQITVTVGVDGVPYEYPKGMGLRYAPVVSSPDTSVLPETPITEDGLSLSVPNVPGINVSSTTVFQKIEGVSISIDNPCVVTFEDHGLVDEDIIKFTTTGALPTGLTAGVLYYVDYIDANSFYVEVSVGGDKVATSGTQSGTHTLWYKLL